MDLFEHFWTLDALLIGVFGLLLGWSLKALWGRRAQQAAIDVVHRRCWAEQDQWLDEHESALQQAREQLAEVDVRADALKDECEAANDARDLARAATVALQGELDLLRSAAMTTEIARRSLAEERERMIMTLDQMRRQMDSARASHRHAEQALCQQLLALDRQISAERTAHRREVQALRMQCDELRESVGAMLAERTAMRECHEDEREALQGRLDEAMRDRRTCDALRQEVAKLLGLLDEADAAQASLQNRVTSLDQQLQQGQRQLADVHDELTRERDAARQARQQLERQLEEAHHVPAHRLSLMPPPMRPVAQAALELHGGASEGAAAADIGHERRVYPARLPAGVIDRRGRQQRELVAA